MDFSKIDAQLRSIWAFLAPSEEAVRSDVIFVFGGIDLAVPARASQLYSQGFAPSVLVSGSAGALTRKHFDQPEALVFADAMIKHGTPSEKIVIEDKATNTLENVRFGMATLEGTGIEVSSALLVAKPFLMRRCLATFERCFPAIEVRSCPPEGGPMEFCDRDPGEFAARLVAEVERLDRYGSSGDIARVDVPADVRQSCDELRQLISP